MSVKKYFGLVLIAYLYLPSASGFDWDMVGDAFIVQGMGFHINAEF